MGAREWLVAVLPVAGLAADVAAQVAAFRLAPRWGLLRSLVLAFGLGLAAVVLAAAALVRDLPLQEALGHAAASAITYAALGYGYFHFVNLGETARRIRILRELHDAPAGLTLEELLARYGGRAIVEARVARLLRNGQIVREGDRYRIGRPIVLGMARTLDLLKRLLAGL